MRKERLGFKYDGGLIVKSPETGIAAKVQLSEDRTPVAYLLNWIDEINLEMKAIEEEKILDKNKIISVMLLFYLVITGLCICLSNVVVGIIASLFFIATTIDKCYFFLPKIILVIIPAIASNTITMQLNINCKFLLLLFVKSKSL